MKYRKRPVVVEAVLWNGNNLNEVISFSTLHQSAFKWTWEEYEEIVKRDGLKIFTLEGTMSARVGDWIIRGVKGEYYPCKPEIFEETYEKYEDAPQEIVEAKPEQPTTRKGAPCQCGCGSKLVDSPETGEMICPSLIR